jgi:2-octaprenylphenol hydroxylase
MSQHTDVMIVGGGMVGATLALCLAQQSDLNITLIEAYAPTPLADNDPFEIRVSALTTASQQLLSQLDVWSQLNASRLGPFSDMHVWEQQTSAIHFDAADQGLAWLGHIVENQHLQATLWTACQQHSQITLLCPAKPTAYENGVLILDDGRKFTAEVVVAADGAQSMLRQWAGIELNTQSYDQQGLVCNVATSSPHQNTAWQRFLPSGPLAFLPLADPYQCSIVWSLPSDEADRLKTLDEAKFNTHLAQAFEHQLGEIKTVSHRACFPLKKQHAKTYVKQGLALVGDAAHTIHPLAGQGVNIGLLDAATLADILIEAHEKGRSLGQLSTLQKYERKRRADNQLMQLSMDMFNHLFSNDMIPLSWLRQQGLTQVNKHTWLKNRLMAQAAVRDFSKPNRLK